MWTESQLAYLAGIIDGEGTFYIGRNGTKFNSRMYVVNTDERLIKWLHQTFGGLVYQRTSTKNPHWKRKFEWILEKSRIDSICFQILHHLIVKKEQAELMIEFRKSFRKGERKRITHEVLAFRTSCLEKMKTLNHRIPNPL